MASSSIFYGTAPPGRAVPSMLLKLDFPMIDVLVFRLYSTQLPQAAGRQLTDRVGTRHGNLTPPRIAPSCPHRVVPVSPGAVAGQEYHDGWRGSDQGSFGSPGRNAKQPATGCFVDGWVPLRTLCAALIGASVEGRDFPSRLSPYRWSWRILQRRFSPPPGGLSPANVSRCRIFTCQGDSQSLNSDDGSGFYMAGELD